MSHRTTLGEAATLLKALTKDAPGDVEGLDDIDTDDRIRLLVTCCATVIGHMLLICAGHDRAEALKGLDLLVADMRDNIGRCGREQQH